MYAFRSRSLEAISRERKKRAATFTDTKKKKKCNLTKHIAGHGSQKSDSERG